MIPERQAMEEFYEAVADEILFIIVEQNISDLTAEKLCQEFEKRVGVKLVHFVGVEGRKFVRSSPVLSTTRLVNEDGSASVVYMTNYKHCALFPCGVDHKYREMLLIKAWKLIKDNGLSDAYCDNSGDSAFHYLVGIPGATTSNLVQLLLQAGGDDLALQTNKKGQNILHVIAGRMRAEKSRTWTTEDRKAILDVLEEELSSNDLTVLVTAQDEIGDTAMHEWTLSASTKVNECPHLDIAHVEKEIEIGSLLLDFGALLRLPNHSGHVPLHYAFHIYIFEFLVQRCAVCHVRNDLGETPFMFMIKTIIRQALSQTCVTEYPELTTEFLERVSTKQVSVNTLAHVLELVEESEVRDTVRDTDIYGNSIFDIVLLSIKIASHDFFEHPRFDNLDDGDNFLKSVPVIKLGRDLGLLLEKIMPIRAISENMRQDKQHPLHTLLNIHPNIHDLKCDNTAILKSLDTLLQQGVDVNAVDTHGLTALDIAYMHSHIQPPFYTEIINKLLQYGARRSAQSCKRVIRSSCPKSHLKKATELAKATGTEDNVTVVGDYRYFNDAPIGYGAFSSVFLAIKDDHLDDRSGTMYCSCFALKRIEKAKVNPKEINREVKTLISLSNGCANIVKYYGDKQSEDAFFQYLCLDLMDGDLKQFVTNNLEILITKESRMSAVRDIISGVEFLHENDFIHRDLKPGNILYTTDPNLHFKIADFGLSKNVFTLSTMTSTRGNGVAMAPGTRCWMAPELISMKSREHSKESDVFSLGLVLHYLLTLGKHPFATGSEEPAHVIERRIVDTQISIDRALHPEATSFLHQLLSKNPSKRPPAKYLNQHPFLWSERKKIEFLKAVGSQPEAVNPANSTLEQRLQTTTTGNQLSLVPWSRYFPELFNHMTSNRKKRKIRKYRTTKMIDFLRFIRNAYSHQEERSLQDQRKLDSNVFLRKYPSLVLDVLMVVQQLGSELNRSSIRQALEMK